MCAQYWLLHFFGDLRLVLVFGNVQYLSDYSIVKVEIQPVHCTCPQNPSGYRSLHSELPAQAHQTGILKYLDFEIGPQISSSSGCNSYP